MPRSVGAAPAADLYTSALIDQINKFDRAAIVRYMQDDIMPWARSVRSAFREERDPRG